MTHKLKKKCCRHYLPSYFPRSRHIIRVMICWIDFSHNWHVIIIVNVNAHIMIVIRIDFHWIVMICTKERKIKIWIEIKIDNWEKNLKRRGKHLCWNEHIDWNHFLIGNRTTNIHFFIIIKDMRKNHHFLLRWNWILLMFFFSSPASYTQNDFFFQFQ